MRILADAMQQRLPFSESLLLIPLALEGQAGARPQGCAKVSIAGKLENAFRQRFTVTRCHRKAAAIFFKEPRDFAVSAPMKIVGRPAAAMP